MGTSMLPTSSNSGSVSVHLYRVFCLPDYLFFPYIYVGRISFGNNTMFRRALAIAPRPRGISRGHRFALQGLEDRTLPAAFVVNALTDTGTGSGNSGDLRYCLAQANDEITFPGEDTITFDATVFATLQTIHVGSQMSIASGLVMTGPMANVMINADLSAFRVFNIDVPSATQTPVSIANMILTGGGAISTGSCIQNIDEALTLTNCSILGNKGSSAIFLSNAAATLSATDCLFADNIANTAGGAIRANATGFVGPITLMRCSITGNSAAGNGGGIFFNSTGALNMDGCTVAGNTATSGGAIGLAAAAATIINSTIANNVGSGGAGIRLGNFGTSSLSLHNCTVTGNSGTTGGGLYRGSSSGQITLYSTIVSGNAGTTADVFSAGTATITGNDNLIGTSNANVFYSGTNQINVSNPQLGGLWNIGGDNVNLFGNPGTEVPLSGSPAIDMGDNNLGLPYDQRGVTPYNRVVGTQSDVGAVEGPLVTPYPSAFTIPSNIITPGSTTNTVTVTIADETGVNVNTIAPSNINIKGPDGSTLFVTGVTVSPPGNGSPRTATYTFSPPVNGSTGWDNTDNGIYIVSLVGGQVTDTDATPHTVNGGLLGVFYCLLGDTLTVNATTDMGTGSGLFGDLRYCLNKSNASSGLADSIVFDSAVFTTGTTITLASALPVITDSLNIDGPSAGNFKLQGNGKAGFAVSANVVVNISNLAISGLSSTVAGGVFNMGISAVVNATNVQFSINKTSAAGGGGVFGMIAANAKVVVDGCLFTGNSAIGSGSGGVISGIANSSFIASNCAFSGNSANHDGGAIFFNSGSSALTTRNCTLAGNTAGGAGGAIAWSNSTSASTPVAVINSTVSGNKANGSGGGIQFDDASGTLNLVNSTIASNTAAANGGGVNLKVGGVAHIVSSIIAGNAAAAGPDIYAPAAANVNVDSSNIGNSSGITVLTQTGFNLIDVDPMIAPLADNGGFSLPDGNSIQTNALMPGSPAINTGSNTLALTFDERGVGFPRAAGGQADMGAFEFQSAAMPPTVTNLKIGDGTVQRSMITSLTVTFSEAVTFTGAIASAFLLNRDSAPLPVPGAEQGGVTGLVNLSAVQAGNVVTLTFNSTGSNLINGVGGVGNLSLPDGRYTLTIDATQVFGVGGALDGDGNGIGGDNYVLASSGAPNPPTNIFRFFGDVTGDGAVTSADFVGTGPAGIPPNIIGFRQSFGGTDPRFDYNGDGSVAASDFTQFRFRFGGTVP
jgi:hypothetical protein